MKKLLITIGLAAVCLSSQGQYRYRYCQGKYYDTTTSTNFVSFSSLFGRVFNEDGLQVISRNETGTVFEVMGGTIKHPRTGYIVVSNCPPMVIGSVTNLKVFSVPLSLGKVPIYDFGTPYDPFKKAAEKK